MKVCNYSLFGVCILTFVRAFVNSFFSKYSVVKFILILVGENADANI